MPATGPPHIGARHTLTIGLGDHTEKALLHVLAKRVVRGELGDLGAAGATLGVLLGPALGVVPTQVPNAADRSLAAEGAVSAPLVVVV
jgi:hypothetical protein